MTEKLWILDVRAPLHYMGINYYPRTEGGKKALKMKVAYIKDVPNIRFKVYKAKVHFSHG